LSDNHSAEVLTAKIYGFSPIFSCFDNSQELEIKAERIQADDISCKARNSRKVAQGITNRWRSESMSKKAIFYSSLFYAVPTHLEKVTLLDSITH
jgi:hypothetical protein